MTVVVTPFVRQFFHGTRADLSHGDLISVGYGSNYRDGRSLSWVYFSATMDAAIWGAELAVGDGRERIYIVEPTGEIADDPNVTDKRFPGNPMQSYRSREPLRVVAEAVGWQGHTSERIKEMRDGLDRLKAAGADEIID